METIKLVCDFVMKMYLYADSIKKIHYSTHSNHEHELCDEIREEIISFTDEFAEQMFGFIGKPQFTSFRKMTEYDIDEKDNLSEICVTMSNMTDMMRDMAEKNNKLSGIVSLIDDFKGNMNKYKFLSTFDKISKK